jgi:hypothetical protein
VQKREPVVVIELSQGLFLYVGLNLCLFKAKNQIMRKIILALLLAFGISSAAIAHSGGTDQYGCHNNHKTGGYHCH